MYRYRRLDAGELIREGDEIDSCRDPWRDDPVWTPVTSCIGEPAPDPNYVSHRQYRRKCTSVWIVLDDTGIPHYCAAWPEACHEHIADAINDEIDGAARWVVREAMFESALSGRGGGDALVP